MYYFEIVDGKLARIKVLDDGSTQAMKKGGW
jgi:hypothetical protein